MSRKATFARLQARPLTPKFGAELRGIDLTRDLDEHVIDAVQHLIAEAAVVVIPDQALDDDQQIAFSRRLGPLEAYPAVEYLTQSKHRQIAVVSNVDPETDRLMPPLDRRRAYNDANALWHSDSSFRAVPAAMSILSAREVPPSGGNTEFADMRLPWDALPVDRKSELSRLVARHSLSYSRRRLSGFTFNEGEERAVQSVRQPLVRVHPVSGRRALYLGAHIGPIEGISDEESSALVNELQALGTRDDLIYSHQWRANDVVIWDNRSVLHRATPYLQNTYRRVMHRTVVAEPRPLIEQA